MNTTVANKTIVPETYPLLKDPFEGKASMTQVGELTTYGVSTAYTPVAWNNAT